MHPSEDAVLGRHDNLRAILRASFRLKYVNMETRLWQRADYTRFFKLLAHGRHSCVEHDDPLGEGSEYWHEQFFYLVTREAPCWWDGATDFMIRNVNDLEREVGHVQFVCDYDGHDPAKTSSVARGFE